MTYNAGICGKDLITAYYVKKDGILDIESSYNIVQQLKEKDKSYMSDMGTAIQKALGGKYWIDVIFESIRSINDDNGEHYRDADDDKKGIVFKFNFDSGIVYILFKNFEMNLQGKHIITDF